MMFIYLILLVLLTIYSFFLVDPNLTLINHPFWTSFRNFSVNIGYYQRQTSWIIYLIIIISLFILHCYLLTKYKNINPLRIAFFIGIILVFSYPFLSRDFFNYLFDARILTHYGKNPYFYKALDFPNDPWLRFMHWTHRTYPYGPTFLLLTLAPSFLSFGKFVLNFFLFKLTFVGFYIMAVYFLNRINKQTALIFATHPLVIIEGLVNNHNDLIGVSLAIVGIYYMLNNKNIVAKVFYLVSGGIKYITLPLLFLSNNKSQITNHKSISKFKYQTNNLVFFIQIIILAYLSFSREIQPWYFLTLLIFLPFYRQLINRLNIFFFGLLLSYYPFIRFGEWDKTWKINLKHQIILVFFMINIIYLLLLRLRSRSLPKSQ